MQNHFKGLSISHKNAPVQIREQLSFNEGSCKELLIKLNDFITTEDLLVLSTCNRTEIYYNSPEDRSEDILKILGIYKGITDVNTLQQYFTFYNEPIEAAKHLFEVAVGLDAQVTGDIQITNQVKNAYQWTADLDLAGPFLHRLMHTIFYTNKKIVQETSFREGAASIAYLGVELIEDLVKTIHNPRILILGIGEIGEDVARHLYQEGYKHVTITNRTASKAENLAEELGFASLPFENAWDGIREADVVVSSLGVDAPFIHTGNIEHTAINFFKYFIDLSVPRSIETSIDHYPGVILYNIDELQKKASEAVKQREAAIPRVRELIEESLSDFQSWTRDMAVSPVINNFKSALERIRQEEIARHMRKMDPEESEKIDMITKNIMQKVIKMPVMNLKAACKRGEEENLIGVLNDLFNLEKEEKEAKEASSQSSSNEQS